MPRCEIFHLLNSLRWKRFSAIRSGCLDQMSSSFNFILPLVFASLISALSLPPSLSLIQTTDIHNGTFSNLTDRSHTCSGTWGGTPRIASCRNAWNKMDHFNTTQQKFVYGHGNADVSAGRTPIRYLSDDGTCAIDVSFARNPIIADFSTAAQLSEQAGSIFWKCVVKKGWGGSAYGFSTFLLHIWYWTTFLQLPSNNHSPGYFNIGTRNPAT